MISPQHYVYTAPARCHMSVHSAFAAKTSHPPPHHHNRWRHHTLAWRTGSRAPGVVSDDGNGCRLDIVEQDKDVLGQRLPVVERRRQVVHAVAVVDELSRQTHNHLIAALKTANKVVHFRGSAEVFAIANVETQAPLILGSRQQTRAQPARDSRHAAQLASGIDSMQEIRHRCAYCFFCLPEVDHHLVTCKESGDTWCTIVDNALAIRL